jgi:hypothetical protein
MKYLARMVKDGDRFHGNQQICIMMPSDNYSYPKIEIKKTVMWDLHFCVVLASAMG